ncbi:MAG TPA: hypothetical protein VMU89_14790 [Thermomicrobiaceae bacterium]|nr:hypothetical protein [Thermomicrobiaceae bacterium]
MATPPPIPPAILGVINPPSGGDWALFEVIAPNVLPQSVSPGIDQSTHVITPFSAFPSVEAWVNNFLGTAAARGKRVYYVGVWGSPSRNSYNIITVTDQ